jgi:DNA-binding MarR family transcriptional regulator
MARNKEQTSEPNYYGILPAEVRYCKFLSASEKVLYCEFAALSNKKGYAWASNTYFAEIYDVEPTTVSEWIQNLKKYGFINIINPKGRSRKISLLPIFRKNVKAMKEPKEIPEGQPTVKAETNITSLNNTSKDTTTVVASTEDGLAPKVFNYEEEIQKLLSYKSDSARWLRVIGAFLSYKKIQFTNAKQLSSAISRNSRVAKRLANFEESKVLRAFKYCDKMTGRSGEPINWSLETVEKQLLSNPNI